MMAGKPDIPLDYEQRQEYRRQLVEAYERTNPGEKLDITNSVRAKGENTWFVVLGTSLKMVLQESLVPKKDWLLKLVEDKKQGFKYFDPRYINLIKRYIAKCNGEEAEDVPQAMVQTPAQEPESRFLKWRGSRLTYDEDKINGTAKILNRLYREDKLDEGLKLAQDAFDDQGPHPKLLRRLFLFEMRKFEYHEIRKIIQLTVNALQNAEEELSEERKLERSALFQLTLFECEYREADYFVDERHTKLEKLRKAKELFLDAVPETYRQKSEEYYGWLGRWFLAVWWFGTRQSALLHTAKHHLQKAISIAESIKKNTWWLQCYKCIVLKLIDSDEFKSESARFNETMSRLFRDQERCKQASVKIYRATSLILSGDIKGLRAHVTQTTLEATDFRSTISYHIDLIYYTEAAAKKSKKSIAEKQMRTQMETMVKDWLRK